MIMKNIAIFVSGAGEAAERIVKLFNEGNRLHTVLVVTDDSGQNLLPRLEGEDVTLLHIPDEEWPKKSIEIAGILKEKEVRLLVLDGFNQVIPDEVMEATDGEMIRVSSPEQAPREVVAALEADLRKPEEVKQEVTESQEEQPPTPESEWAETLKIQFRPPKIPNIPPDVPSQVEEIIEEPRQEREPSHEEYYRSVGRPDTDRRYNPQKGEPMPSTWLIWSILVTVFCCFIPGIIAVIFSSQVSSRYYSGDIEGARRASRTAEIWIIVSFVLGVLSATLYLPFMLVGGI